jgi:hypothetical protein
LGFLLSAMLLASAIHAQTTGQQIVADAAAALGGRDRVLAVKTLIVQGGGHDLNVGQSLRYDELGLQSDVWQIRDYKRVYDLANGRARFEVVRASQYPYTRASVPTASCRRSTVTSPSTSRATAAPRVCSAHRWQRDVPSICVTR